MLLNLKLVIRSWWRNKTYFFIHEYNIESTNPNRESIYILQQDSPMEKGEKVTYTHSNAAKYIKDKYAEVKSMLHIDMRPTTKYEFQGNKMAK